MVMKPEKLPPKPSEDKDEARREIRKPKSKLRSDRSLVEKDMMHCALSYGRI